MRYVVWTFRLFIFIAVLLFAYQNVTAVDVVFYGGWRLTGVPLIVVILLSFVVGAAFGAVLMLPSRWRGWRESGRLRRDLSKANAPRKTRKQTPDADHAQVPVSDSKPQASPL